MKISPLFIGAFLALGSLFVTQAAHARDHHEKLTDAVSEALYRDMVDSLARQQSPFSADSDDNVDFDMRQLKLATSSLVFTRLAKLQYDLGAFERDLKAVKGSQVTTVEIPAKQPFLGLGFNVHYADGKKLYFEATNDSTAFRAAK